ncbi:hypothetical protein [Halorubrum tropicale]|uniref:Uncharacterized protein n=1 Tax=Halorubrum tropicale TaxID=1765655 RepID=A0A0M9AL29_9EURY|nr:hypothetical protein [Halorubrum tropicale]KOX94237.1 hypothetical protein AMR74_16150 [Halorubrum tropicale]
MSDEEETKRAHKLIAALRNDGYDVAYGADTNEDFPDHVGVARDALEDPDELMGYFLVAMTEGQTDYYSSTVLGDGTPVALAQIQMLGAHFWSVLETTSLDTTDLIDVMVDEALTIDGGEGDA